MSSSQQLHARPTPAATQFLSGSNLPPSAASIFMNASAKQAAFQGKGILPTMRDDNAKKASPSLTPQQAEEPVPSHTSSSPLASTSNFKSEFAKDIVAITQNMTEHQNDVNQFMKDHTAKLDQVLVAFKDNVHSTIAHDHITDEQNGNNFRSLQTAVTQLGEENKELKELLKQVLENQNKPKSKKRSRDEPKEAGEEEDGGATSSDEAKKKPATKKAKASAGSESESESKEDKKKKAEKAKEEKKEKEAAKKKEAERLAQEKKEAEEEAARQEALRAIAEEEAEEERKAEERAKRKAKLAAASKPKPVAVKEVTFAFKAREQDDD
jgi:hypothetical protein